jgi:hypothetical protein
VHLRVRTNFVFFLVQHLSTVSSRLVRTILRQELVTLQTDSLFITLAAILANLDVTTLGCIPLHCRRTFLIRSPECIYTFKLCTYLMQLAVSMPIPTREAIECVVFFRLQQ